MGTLGYKHTEEAKRKIKEHHAKYWLGKKLSDKTMKKILDKKQYKLKDIASAKVNNTLRRMFLRNGIEKICALCNATKDIHIHHKDTNHSNNNMNNLIMLCRSCHFKEHSRIKKENLAVPMTRNINILKVKYRRKK